jgi:hypothetical protein
MFWKDYVFHFSSMYVRYYSLIRGGYRKGFRGGGVADIWMEDFDKNKRKTKQQAKTVHVWR